MQPHEFWQEILPADRAEEPPFQQCYPARMPDGRFLLLPIRPLAGSEFGIASLILNQASFAVEAALADELARRLARLEVEIIVGLPTLGLSLARAVAERLGHLRFVALGISRKFWYEDELSVPLSSITSPSKEKRLYLDPRMVPVLNNRRFCLIDDVISTGTSISAALDLMRLMDRRPDGIGAAMLQTDRWIANLDQEHEGSSQAVVGVIQTPLLVQSDMGWIEFESSKVL